MFRSAKAKFSLRKGDFFYANATDSKGLTGHNAIYVGNGKIVEAPAKGHKEKKKGNGLKFIDLQKKQMGIRQLIML